MKCLLPILLFWTCVSVGQTLYFPPAGNTTWDTLSPSSLNWCSTNINEFYNFLGERGTKSFILLKDGKIVLEKYFNTYTRDSIFPWFSAGKSLRAVLIGIAQQEGLLNIEDKTSTYIGEGWTSLPKAKEDLITIRHQLSMTSGLNELAFTCVTPSCLTYVADAGERWIYHNGPYNLLENILEVATNQSNNVYTNLKVKTKTGMSSGIWIPSGNNTYYLSTARDMARFGLLIQNKGKWAATSVITDTTYFNQMLKPSQYLNPSYGYLWWLNGQGVYIPPTGPIALTASISQEAPEDVVLAAGAFGQFISISPSTGLVMVRQGLSSTEDPAELELHNEIWQKINTLNCITTAISKLPIESIKVYPNPATQWIEVTGVDAINSQLTLFDLYGRPLKQINNRLQLDISDLTPGVYILSLKKNNSIRAQKLIIH